MKEKNLRRTEASEDEFDPDNPPFQTPDMESTSSHEQVGEAESGELDKRVCIHFHSRRRRLADPDGVSCKAAMDGLVQGGILPDDSAKYVKEVSFSQEVSATEETVIEIKWD